MKSFWGSIKNKFKDPKKVKLNENDDYNKN